MLHESMLTSRAFQRLSQPAKYLYLCCLNQYTSKSGRAVLFNYAREQGEQYPPNMGYFVFPSSHYEQYGIKPQNGSKYMNELIAAGFVVREEQNRYRHKPNVYRFSSGWYTGH